MVPGCLETFGLQAACEGIFPLQQVGGQVAQDGQVFRADGRLWEEQGHVLMEIFLVVFDLDDIIGVYLDNRLG